MAQTKMKKSLSLHCSLSHFLHGGQVSGKMASLYCLKNDSRTIKKEEKLEGGFCPRCLLVLTLKLVEVFV